MEIWQNSQYFLLKCKQETFNVFSLFLAEFCSHTMVNGCITSSVHQICHSSCQNWVWRLAAAINTLTTQPCISNLVVNHPASHKLCSQFHSLTSLQSSDGADLYCCVLFPDLISQFFFFAWASILLRLKQFLWALNAHHN